MCKKFKTKKTKKKTLKLWNCLLVRKKRFAKKVLGGSTQTFRVQASKFNNWILCTKFAGWQLFMTLLK